MGSTIFPYYFPQTSVGIKSAVSNEDGYSIKLDWVKAYPSSLDYTLGYNIYYSTKESDVFKEGVKYLSLGQNITSLIIDDFFSGDTYYFAVRATQFLPSWINLNSLPNSGESKIYPESSLLQDLSLSGNVIYLSDASSFPSFGIVQIGGELIQYTNVDYGSSQLSGLTRGFLNTNIRFHNIDGYDGYYTQDPFVKIFKGLEENNYKIFQETSNFKYPNYSYTSADGYKFNKDLVYINTSNSDANESDFPYYDMVGWRRTNPQDYLTGKCIGSYFGGERYCADGYDGVGRQLRGLSVTDESARRQELLLEQVGKEAVLLRRNWSQIRCSCYTPVKQYPDDRCPKCFGTGFVYSYEQFFNPRRSNGRILVRLEAADEDIPYQDVGLENTYAPSGWTLLYPAIKDRDVLIIYDSYDSNLEESRFEITKVTRNFLFYGTYGAQKFSLARIRKTDPVYKINVFSDSSMMPEKITTSIAMSPGILPHTHTITVSENITSLSQINQLTSSGGANEQQQHSHEVRNGVVLPTLGHTHTIIL